MSDKINAVKVAVGYNPVAVQAFLIKWGIILAIAALLLGGSYLQGRRDGKQNCLGALKTVAAKVADKRADNAIDATKRFGEYSAADRELEIGIDDAMQQVRDYYANQAGDATVETSKLKPVPGKKEYVYVPSGTCSTDFLSPDELHLYNVGNARGDFDASDSK